MDKPRCASCFAAHHRCEEEPDMADADWVTFTPGRCDTCGAHAIVFTIAI